MNCPRCRTQNAAASRVCAACGAPLEKAGPGPAPRDERTETMSAPAFGLAAGEVFAGRYRVIEEIGRGGMGRVYKVFDTTIEENVALKIIAPEIADEPRVLERFRQELKLARRVTHPNVCRVFDIGEAEGRPYITMEFCPGDTLRGLIAKAGALGVATAVDYGRQICSGLAEAHKLGIVHRDLKPRNIIVDERQRLRIMDFGIARLGRDEASTRENLILGTPDYMAPEQIDGAPADNRTDIYALGIILYETLTGHPPFEGGSTMSLAFRQKNAAPRPPIEENPVIPPALNALILRCLEKDKAERYPDVEAVRTGLEAVARDLGPAGAFGAAERTARGTGADGGQTRGRVFSTLTAGGAVVLLAAFLAWLISINTVRGPAPAGWDDRLAVLPFLKAGPGNSHLAEDMTIDVWTKLNNAGFKKLIGLSSSGLFGRLRPRLVDRLKTTRARLAETGRSLGARHLLTARLRVDGEHLTVIPVMADAASGRTVWTSPFIGLRSQYLLLDSDIIEALARIFKAQAGPSPPHRDPASAEAHSDYIIGNAFSNRYRTYDREEDFAEAEAKYDAALKLDPGFADIHRAKGDLYEARYVKTNDPAALAKMVAHYERAHVLDPERAEFLVGMGWSSFYQKDEEAACRYFAAAYAARPDSAEVTFGIGAFLRTIGLYDIARRYFLENREISRELDRLSPQPAYQLAACEWYLGEYDRAGALLAEILEKEPKNDRPRVLLARQHLSRRDYDAAEAEIAAFKKPEAMTPSYRQAYKRNLIWLHAARGRVAEMNALLAEADRPFAYEITNAYALLGWTEKALQNIRDGISLGFEKTKDFMYEYLYLVNNALFESLRENPEFRKILEDRRAAFESRARIFAPLGERAPHSPNPRAPG